MALSPMTRGTVLLCGPPLSALGGGPTHIRNMLASPLKERYTLVHFESGSRGSESPATDEQFPAKAFRIFTSPFVLAKQILRSAPEIVHLNSAIDHKAFWRDLVYMTISKLLGRKVIFQLHGGSLPLSALRGPFLMDRLTRVVFWLPDALVLLATTEKHDFSQLGLSGRLVVIPNGVNVAEYRGHDRIHSGRVKRLCYLGRLFRPKGIFEVVEAIDLLRSDADFKDIEFRIAGTGPAQRELEELIRVRKLSGYVKLVGPLYGPAKVEFLRGADLFVFPSYHQEGLPYSVLESLAAGTPVVVSRVAGITDVAVDRVHGLFVEPGNPGEIVRAVRELSQSADTLRAMSRNCVECASQKFGLERLAARFEELYESLRI